MILGRLVGTVWATRKNPRLERFKLAIVRPYHWYNPPHDIDHIIAVDNVGAAPGQDVLVCLGQPGRWNAGDYRCPIEASVMGIVDEVRISKQCLEDHGLQFELRGEFLPGTLRVTAEDTAVEDRRA